MAGETMTVLIVEDHRMLREGLVDYFRMRWPDVTVLEADSMAMAGSLCSSADHPVPNVVLLDLNLQDASGLSAISQMRKCTPQARIVVLSGTVDDSLFFQMQELGADDFVSKTGKREDLVNTVEAVLTASMAGPLPSRRKMTTRLQLSERQLHVLELLIAGQSNKEIARLTGLAPGTVRNHVSDIFLAFNVHTRSQLSALFR